MADCACSNFPASLGNVTFGASVGIGTMTPAARLDVVAAGAQEVRFGFTGAGRGVAFKRAGDVPNIQGLLTDDWSSPAHIVLQGSGGSIGIGTSMPHALLDVVVPGTQEVRFGFTGAGRALVFKRAGDVPNVQGVLTDDWFSPAHIVLQGSGGSLGIGTPMPHAFLDVVVPGTQEVRFGFAGAGRGVAIKRAGDFPNVQGLLTSDWATPVNLVLQGAGGNVGIGTTAPAAPLQIGDLTPDDLPARLRFASHHGTGGGVWDIGTAVDVSSDTARYGFAIRDQQMGATRVVVGATSGYVGIGTPTPAALLHVAGNIRADGAINTENQHDITSSGDVVATKTFTAKKGADSSETRVIADFNGCYYA